jgi:hypothetical protein
MIIIVINESESIPALNYLTFDLNKIGAKDCTGCWTCWWKTPGRCIYNDLDDLYHHYITADKAIYIAKVKKGFVSSTLKSLFDRMLPLYLPYVVYGTGESMHVPRYDKYPDIEFYYEGEFDQEHSRQIFIDYIHRVFYQFHSKNVVIKPIEELKVQAGEVL